MEDWRLVRWTIAFYCFCPLQDLPRESSKLACSIPNYSPWLSRGKNSAFINKSRVYGQLMTSTQWRCKNRARIAPQSTSFWFQSQVKPDMYSGFLCVCFILFLILVITESSKKTWGRWYNDNDPSSGKKWSLVCATGRWEKVRHWSTLASDIWWMISVWWWIQKVVETLMLPVCGQLFKQWF